MENKPTFIFNLAWYDALKDYAPEVRLEVYEAAMQYAASGTFSELKPLAKMAFSFIKREMDCNASKYATTIEKRRTAAKSRWKDAEPSDSAPDSSLAQPACGPAHPAEPYKCLSPAGTAELQAELLADQTFWEQSSMSLKTSVDTLKALFQDFASEKAALGQSYDSYTDFRHHFFSWARIAVSKNNKPNETKPKDRYAKRRGADSAAVSPEDYTDSL